MSTTNITTASLIRSQFFASLACSTAGTAYAFSLYGPQLSVLLNLTQTETSFIAGCGNAGTFLMGPIFGTLIDSFPTLTPLFHIGGGLLIFVGYYSVGAYVEAGGAIGYIPIALLFFTMGAGSSSIYHSSLSTNYRNFPHTYRSIAVGLTVSFFGLSALLITLIAGLFVIDGTLDVAPFLKTIGAVCFGVNLFVAVGFRRIPKQNEYQVLFQSSVDLEDDSAYPALHIEEEEVEHYQEEEEEARIFHIDPPLQSDALFNTPLHNTPVACFGSTNAALLAYSMLVLSGAGLMYINHVGVIVNSRVEAGNEDMVHEIQKRHVVILSVASFVARILFGVLADYGAGRWKIKKSLWSLVCAMLMTLAYAGLVLGARLEGVSFVVGLSYGAVFTVFPILVGEFFGLQSFAKNWYFIAYLGG